MDFFFVIVDSSFLLSWVGFVVEFSFLIKGMKGIYPGDNIGSHGPQMSVRRIQM